MLAVVIIRKRNVESGRDTKQMHCRPQRKPAARILLQIEVRLDSLDTNPHRLRFYSREICGSKVAV